MTPMPHVTAEDLSGLLVEEWSGETDIHGNRYVRRALSHPRVPGALTTEHVKHVAEGHYVRAVADVEAALWLVYRMGGSE